MSASAESSTCRHDEAVAAIIKAIKDQGPLPLLHRRIMRLHRQEWPTLWQALDKLLDAESSMC